MEIADITWSGPPIDDREVLARVPPELRRLLDHTNGFILRGGLVHFRGASLAPSWHSLRAAWFGEAALARRYPAVASDDVPIAQRCTGDQFFLRAGRVWVLEAETGETHETPYDLAGFLAHVQDPSPSLLCCEILDELARRGGHLEPGQLIHAYPPFCTKESGAGVSLRAIPADELLQAHADFARQISGLADGQKIIIDVVP